MLAADAEGSQPIRTDNFIVGEVFDSTGARVAAFFAGVTGSSPVELGGAALQRLGAEDFSIGPLFLNNAEGMAPDRPVRLRITALDYGAVGETTAIFLVPPPPGQATGAITLQSATYGANCGAPEGNASRFVAWKCSGRDRCEYRVDYREIGDPVPGCGKQFRAAWRCGSGSDLRERTLPAEAGLGSTLVLECETQ